MKAVLLWLLKLVSGIITILAVIVLLPHASRIADELMPDESGAAIKASAIIASRIESSARLETMKVSEDGVIHYDIQAAFIGSVGEVNVNYHYDASFGVNLQQVTMKVSGDHITFFLPEPEVIQDSLVPVETYRDDFWYPGFSDQDYQNLLDKERTARRDVYLIGEQAEALWNTSIKAFEDTIAAWLNGIDPALRITYEKAPVQIDEPYAE